MGDNLSSNSRVHTRHLEVSTYVSVVKVNLWSSSEVGNVLVVDDGVGGGGDGNGSGEGSGGYSSLGEELTASGGLGAEGAGGLDACLGGEGSGGAVKGG